ncbi:oxygen-dependent protoporphyrinogen oxidase [Dissophora ornata]|nr:oxygen-dependent protoporphyrinogen oxidase [Dissophora ornata]
MSPRTHIAVLGGGISGLSTAWYLARTAPSNVAITLLEGTRRTGGWLHSDRVNDPQHPGGSVLLERGPRSLRPQGVSGLNTLEMIKTLHLDPKLEPVLKTSPAAKNRYIYSRNKLHVLPSSLSGALAHPLLAPKLPRAGLDLVKGGSGQEDESIESFVSRRFGKGFSDDLISAMVHGIYAGDVSKLSVRSTFGMLYHLEKDYGSVILGLLMGGGNIETPWDQTLKEKIAAKMPELNEFVDKTSIYSFKDGLEELSRALEKDLVESGRVSIRKNSLVEKMDFDLASRTVSIKGQTPVEANTVISALPPRALHGILPNPYPELIHNPSVTVAVVNLVYNAEQARLASPGFGYLIPRSENSAVNHQGLLGVVFDSCSIPAQDEGASRDQTLKLTAMIGGHMFDDVVAHQRALEHSDPPSTSVQSRHETKGTNDKELESFFEKTATDAVKRHLQIESTPEIAKVYIHQECIPQYLVGHLQRMQTLDQSLRADYDGLLAVTGAGYLGVSVNDCIKNAREVVESMVSKLEEVDDGEAELVGKQDAVTGLERSWFL